jgi:putative NADH-flavin reductase
VKLVVFGATGATGRNILEQALRAGHRVAAVARRVESVRPAHPSLEVLRGDVFEPATLYKPIAEADAVLSVLGIGLSRAATTVYSEGTGNIIQAMEANGVRRLCVLSTTSLSPPPWTEPGLALTIRGLLHPLLRRPYADMKAMEERVRVSGLDWTVIRAARLTHGRQIGGYRLAVDDRVRGGWSISRADVAEYLLTCATDRATYGRTVEIAY